MHTSPLSNHIPSPSDRTAIPDAPPIRITAPAASLLHDNQPRQISFTSTCQYVLASCTQLSNGQVTLAELESYLLTMLKQIAHCEVANRPGRLEPRVLKRRRHRYKLTMKLRNELRREHCTQSHLQLDSAIRY